MSERDLANRFSHEVDRILSDHDGCTDEEHMCIEYRRNLDIVRTLASADFSSESRVRHALRSCLLQQNDARELHRLRQQERKETLMRTIREYVWKPIPAATLAAIALAIIVLPLAWPGALPAAAASLDRYVRSLVVGEHTTVVQYPAEGPAQQTAPTMPNNTWLVQTAICAFGGNVPEGVDPTVKYYPSFEQAKNSIPDVELRQPEYLPRGYYLREALVTPPDGLILVYDGGFSGDLVVKQNPVSGGHCVSVGTNAPVKAVTLNGRQAAWVETTGGRNSLTWEADGTSYTLGGINLGLDEAIRIAQSLN